MQLLNLYLLKIKKEYEEIRSPRFEVTDDSSPTPRNILQNTFLHSPNFSDSRLAGQNNLGIKMARNTTTDHLFVNVDDNTMALTKVQFGEKEVETFAIMFEDDKWMVANPFAGSLNYNNTNKAIRNHVSEKNQKNLEEIQSAHHGPITSSLHPRTKFINQAGVFELINASEMPAAKRFKSWNTNELLGTHSVSGWKI